MGAINGRRVLVGALAGGVAWAIWSIIVNALLLGTRYAAAQNDKLLLMQPRYPLFLGYWIISLFLIAYVEAWLYASARTSRGAGPATAVKIGVMVGFAAGFPMNLSIASWFPLDRVFPLWWMLDLWIGAILASLIAGWLYKEQAAG